VTVGIATMNLILGVVVNVAQQAHDSPSQDIAEVAMMNKMEGHNHLLQLCREMDKDGSGELSKDELTKGYQESEGFRKAFDDMDIVEEDLEIVWTVLDTDKSGAISYAEFIKEVYKLRDSDSQFMLAYIKYYITIIKNSMVEEMRSTKEQIIEVEEHEEMLIEKIAVQEEAMMSQLQAGEEERRLEVVAIQKLDADLQRVQTGTQKYGEAVLSVQTTVQSPVQVATDSSFECLVSDFGKFQNELNESMRDLRSRIDLYSSNTSQMLLELLGKDGSIALPAAPRGVTSGIKSMATGFAPSSTGISARSQLSKVSEGNAAVSLPPPWSGKTPDQASNAG